MCHVLFNTLCVTYPTSTHTASSSSLRPHEEMGKANSQSQLWSAAAAKKAEWRQTVKRLPSPWERTEETTRHLIGKETCSHWSSERTKLKTRLTADLGSSSNSNRARLLLVLLYYFLSRDETKWRRLQHSKAAYGKINCVWLALITANNTV